jgi:hypothetical protein
MRIRINYELHQHCPTSRSRNCAYRPTVTPQFSQAAGGCTHNSHFIHITGQLKDEPHSNTMSYISQSSRHAVRLPVRVYLKPRNSLKSSKTSFVPYSFVSSTNTQCHYEDYASQHYKILQLVRLLHQILLIPRGEKRDSDPLWHTQLTGRIKDSARALTHCLSDRPPATVCLQTKCMT